MTSIPVVWLISIFALLLAAIIARLVRMPVFARMCFCFGLFSISVVTVFVGVRFQFNDPAFIVLQPYLAVTMAPALWLGFHTLTTQTGIPGTGIVQGLAGFVVAAWVIITLPYPWTATASVILVNTLLSARLACLLRLPAERFVHIAPQAFPKLRIALFGCLAFLVLLIVIDISVLGTFLTAGEAQAMALLSDAAVMGVIAISLGVAAGLSLLAGTGPPIEDQAQVEARPLEEDHAVFARLDALMRQTTLFRDPELTVARLGRRLGVPARSVSSAVNRVTGENTSRYINALRVQHAAHLLENSSLPVTDVMLESGFISKSSFNTEFRRITGTTPSEHRKSHSPGSSEVRKHASKRSNS